MEKVSGAASAATVRNFRLQIGDGTLRIGLDLDRRCYSFWLLRGWRLSGEESLGEVHPVVQLLEPGVVITDLFLEVFDLVLQLEQPVVGCLRATSQPIYDGPTQGGVREHQCGHGSDDENDAEYGDE